jgi:hypothetical protein
LRFVKLLEADVVPTGIAIGAHYEWLNDGMGPANLQYESRALGELWERLRTQAHQVDARRAAPLPHDVRIVVDLRAGDTPLTGHTPHHESYRSNESEGAI